MMLKEKYKQLCLYTRFGGIRTIVYTQTLSRHSKGLSAQTAYTATR